MKFTDGQTPTEFTVSPYAGMHTDCSRYVNNATSDDGGDGGDSSGGGGTNDGGTTTDIIVRPTDNYDPYNGYDTNQTLKEEV